ncbi:MAG: 5-(carboxyamino)imidazole ribonucleotide synthase [Alphaproteobacteria bacterium]
MSKITAEKKFQLAPGEGVIGILGGGQLGRMMAIAAANMGYQTHIFSPDEDSPAFDVATFYTRAAYDDRKALAEFAQKVAVITIEFENIPLDSAEYLAQHTPFFPPPAAIGITQDRAAEKSFINGLDISTAPWRAVEELQQIPSYISELGDKAIIKTRRFGYDGKGQWLISPEKPLDMPLLQQELADIPVIIEGFCPFTKEISVIVSRFQDGRVCCYPVTENEHKNHILSVSRSPANISSRLAEIATESAISIAEALNYVGILAVEMFVTPDHRIVVNELAPRPHNSGHWTMDAAPCSQFEQHIRAICGLPAGAVYPCQTAEMVNIIGDDVTNWRNFLEKPHCHLHLYGKKEARSGRKMGHATTIIERGK